MDQRQLRHLPGDDRGAGDGHGGAGQQGGYRYRAGPEGMAPLRQMIGGIAAIFAMIWTVVWLGFYLLVELLGNFLVWLSRTVFEAQGLANFFAGLFGFLQGLGFVTILVVWLAGMVIVIGFYLLTRRASRDAELRWWNVRADRAHPVQEPMRPPDPASGTAHGGGQPPGGAPPARRAGTGGPVTIDLRRDGDTYR